MIDTIEGLADELISSYIAPVVKDGTCMNVMLNAIIDYLECARDLGPVLLPMESAPKDKPIVGWCIHSAAPYTEGPTLAMPYYAHLESLASVEDGPHVLEWGGEYEEDDGRILEWWFLRGADFEIVAYPTHWMPIPQPPAQEPGQ